MIYAVIGRMAFTSAARRNSVLNDINATLAGRTRWSDDTNPEQVRAASIRQGANGIVLEVRCQTQQDADAVKVRIESFAVGQLTPVATSWVETHACHHDSSGACATISRRDW